MDRREPPFELRFCRPPEVVEVRRPLTPVPLEIVSEGVAPSGAQAWQSALGVFAVGRGRVNSGPAGFFAGAVDNVCAYGGAVSDDKLRALGTAPR